jgi:tetratricopeptide (TPR) repeat protein
MLYELLTGVHPFGSVSEEAMSPGLAADLLARQHVPVTPLSTRNRDVEPELSALIDRCLSFDVERRPQSAAALAGALRRLSSWRGRLWRRAWRHRRVLMVSLIPLVAALGIGGYALSTMPPYAHRQFLKAKQAFAHHDLVSTRDYCTVALGAGERTWGTYSLRARALLGMGEFELAREDIENASRCEPHPSTSALLADYQCAIAKWERAIGGYEFAIKNGFETGALLCNIGYANFQSGHPKLALPWLDRAIAADGSLAEAYYLRSVALTQLATGSSQAIPEQAASDMAKAIKLLPDRYGAYTGAAMLHAALAEQNDSAEDRKRAADYVLEALRRGLRVNELPGNGPLFDIVEEIRGTDDFAKAVEAGTHVERVRGWGWVDSLRGTD